MCVCEEVEEVIRKCRIQANVLLCAFHIIYRYSTNLSSQNIFIHTVKYNGWYKY